MNIKYIQEIMTIRAFNERANAWAWLEPNVTRSRRIEEALSCGYKISKDGKSLVKDNYKISVIKTNFYTSWSEWRDLLMCDECLNKQYDNAELIDNYIKNKNKI